MWTITNKTTKTLIDEIAGHVESIEEDLNYGADVNKEQKHRLEEIANFLMNLSEDVGMQNIIEDIVGGSEKDD